MLIDQPLVQSEARGTNSSLARGSEDCTAGFVHVSAIAEAALADIWPEFGQRVGECAVVQVKEAEFLQSR